LKSIEWQLSAALLVRKAREFDIATKRNAGVRWRLSLSRCGQMHHFMQAARVRTRTMVLKPSPTTSGRRGSLGLS
jgi:hypothetical protein